MAHPTPRGATGPRRAASLLTTLALASGALVSVAGPAYAVSPAGCSTTSFATAVHYPVGAGPRSVGWLLAGGVSTLLGIGNGNRTFQAAATYSAGNAAWQTALGNLTAMATSTWRL